MKPKELRHLVVDKVYQGKSFQEIFNELLEAYPGRERDIAEIVADVPTLAQRKKFGWLNIILMIMMALILTLKILAAVAVAQDLGVFSLILNVILPTFYVIFLIGVVNWRTMYHKAAAGLSTFLLILAVIYMLPSEIQPWDFIYPGLLLVTGIIGYYLARNVGGKYQVGSVQSKDASGAVRRKNVVKWLN